jgi:rare lipoprotein A
MLKRPNFAFFAIAAAALLLLTGGCAKKKKVAVPKPPRIGYTEKGTASWYGNPYHGRRSANGEVYDMEKLTAAHRTFPFDTWVRVHDLDNGKQVDVRITDRGPFVKGRIIDLSKAAARNIEMLGPGLAKVRIEVIRAPARPAEANIFGVQVGAFSDRKRAEAIRKNMERKYGSAKLIRRDGARIMWRVVVGSEPDEEAAAQLAERLKNEEPSAFVVRLDAE